MLLLANGNYLKELRTGSGKRLLSGGVEQGCFVPTQGCLMTSEIVISNQ